MFNQISTLWTKANIFLMQHGFLTLAATDEAGGKQGVKSIIEDIMKLFPWIGVIFAVWGGVRIILALRNDGNPEAINGGARDLIVGIALIVFKAMFGDAITGLF